MPNAPIANGYVPGLIGRIAQLHAEYYHAHWGFGSYFEAKVASELAEFIIRYDASRDCIWHAGSARRIDASITIDGVHADDAGAHLRWFIVSDALRGQGLGARLIDTALAFCRAHRYRRVYLWTFSGLDAARHLYESSGFRLAESRVGEMWGSEVEEQRFELSLG